MIEHLSMCSVMVGGNEDRNHPALLLGTTAQGILLLSSFWVPFLLFFFFCLGKVGVRDSVWHGLVMANEYGMASCVDGG